MQTTSSETWRGSCCDITLTETNTHLLLHNSGTQCWAGLDRRKNKSVVSPTAAAFYFYKSFWSVLQSQALETPQLGLHQSLPALLRNLLWNPVEPDLALHQSLPDLLRHLLRNPLEPDLTLSHSAPKPPRPSPEPTLEPSLEPCWTWPGSAPKPPRPSPEPTLEPSPWTWPGYAPKPPRPSPEPSPEPGWTWPGACTSAHQSYSVLKTKLAYAVGEKNIWQVTSVAHTCTYLYICVYIYIYTYTYTTYTCIIIRRICIYYVYMYVCNSYVIM